MMMLFVLFGSLLLFAPILFGPSVFAQSTSTFYVSPNGADSNPGTQAAPWKTLRKAAQTLRAGQTAIVMDGTYTEPEVAFKTSGEPGAKITLQAEHPTLAILSSTSSCNPSISLYASHITIDGLLLTVSPSDALCTSGTTGNQNIYAWNQTDPVRGGNESSGYVGATIRNVHITANTGHRNGSIKIRQDDALVEQSDIEDSMETMWSNNTIFRNNTVYSRPGIPAIILKGGARNTQVYNNVVHMIGTFAYGIMAGGCSGDPWHFDTMTRIENYNAAIYNNVVLNDSGSPTNRAFAFRSDSNSTIFNNVAINAIPIEMARSCATNPPSNANPTFVNNILVGNASYGSGNVTDFTGTRTIDHNNFYGFTSAPAQPHPILGDPQFVNQLSDWRLQPGSPALDAGITVTVMGYNGQMMDVSRDKDGIVRTAPWSLGLYSPRIGDSTPPAAPRNLRVQ